VPDYDFRKGSDRKGRVTLSLRGGGGVGGTRKDALLCTRRRELASVIVWQGLFFNNICLASMRTAIRLYVYEFTT